MKLGAPHSCGESRLTCVDCQAQVCPSCMEQCPVGNRCKKCSSRFDSHLIKVPMTIMLRTFGASALVGLVFGFLSIALWGGFYMWFVLYGGGFLVGKFLHKVASHKLGPKVVATIALGLFLGVVVSPAREPMLGFADTTSGAASVYNDDDDEPMMPAVNLADAAHKARKRLPEFEKAFQERTPKQKFSIKAPFDSGEEVEHLWLDVDRVSEKYINGKVATQPSKVRAELGEEFSIEKSEVEDWMYEDVNGKRVGGFAMDAAIKREPVKVPVANRRAYSPYRSSSVWVSFLIFLAGVLSPIFAVRTRN